jgi:hypothetical protein
MLFPTRDLVAMNFRALISVYDAAAGHSHTVFECLRSRIQTPQSTFLSPSATDPFSLVYVAVAPS